MKNIRDQKTMDWCEELEGLAYAPVSITALFTHTTNINAAVSFVRKLRQLAINALLLKRR